MLVETLALGLQASALLQARSPVADAFIRGRLSNTHGLALGTLPGDIDFVRLIGRALPG
jgi:hypothetical protein